MTARKTIDDCKDVALKRKGKCLSTHYVNNHIKLKWKCEKNHFWMATLSNVKNGTWCPECKRTKLHFSKKLKNGLKIAQLIAYKKKGICLSERYINIMTHMKWKCSNGHTWSASLNNVKNSGQWCPYCANVKLKNALNIAKQLAKDRGGKCLTIKYKNVSSKMTWACKNGHKWKASMHDVKDAKSWCPYCGGKRIYNGLKIAQKIAKGKDGKCLSKIFVSSTSKMYWECKNKHKWRTSLSTVKNKKSWCPECGRLKSAKSSNNTYILHHWKTGENLICQASWEKKVVEYFNESKIDFRWQPRSFLMPDGRKYYPDLYLFSTKKWIEIKGYFRKDAQEKWNWFHKEKPNSELWDKKKLKSIGIL